MHSRGRFVAVLLLVCVALILQGRASLKEPEPPEVPDVAEEEVSEEEIFAAKPNELGSVMIIMYHDISDHEDEWVRTRENFRNDLERFYESGYSLVPLNDYLTGTMNAPLGRSPLVLTFDDGTRGQFRFIEEDGELVVDPDCAVGILLDFEEKHPEFGHSATFYVNYPAPFGNVKHVKEKLSFLIEHGMEIGNHTYNHENLQGASATQIACEIGKLAKAIDDAFDYPLLSLALPYGGYPKDTSTLARGNYDGHEYENLGVLLVGAEAAPSPHSSKFKPMAIPRIRGSQEELDKWLGYFERFPERRYVSDGDAGVVTVRRGEESSLDEGRVGESTVRTYDPAP